jgi:hypothetical protein
MHGNCDTEAGRFNVGDSPERVKGNDLADEERERKRGNCIFNTL